MDGQYRMRPALGAAAASTMTGRRRRSNARPSSSSGPRSRDLADDDPRGWRLGGGVSYSALTTARLGLATAAIVGVDGEAATATEIDLLREAGVDVRLVPLEHGPIFVNIERPEGRLQLCESRPTRSRSRRCRPTWRAAPGWILAPVAAELPPAWADVPASEAVVALGWQGLLRELVAGEPTHHVAPHPDPIVRRADLVGLSRDDVERDVALADLYRLLRRGASLAVTQGDQGGLIVHGAHGDGRRRRWSSATTRRSGATAGRPDRRRRRVPRGARGGPDRAAARRRPDRPGASTCSSPPRPRRSSSRGPGMHGVPTRDAVRERMRDALRSRRGRRRASGRGPDVQAGRDTRRIAPPPAPARPIAALSAGGGQPLSCSTISQPS